MLVTISAFFYGIWGVKMWTTIALLFAVLLILGVFFLIYNFNDIWGNRSKRFILVLASMLFLSPYIVTSSYQFIAFIDKLVFNPTGWVQLQASVFMIPENNDNYCQKNFTTKNGESLNLISLTAKGTNNPICGEFYRQSKDKYLEVPYKELADGSYVYWANLDTRYYSKLSPVNLER